MSINVEHVKERHGLFRNVPRFLRRAIEQRLAALEADSVQFDKEAVERFVQLKRLYALLHIKPGRRAKATLFEKPPTDSPRAALAELASQQNTAAAAGVVRRHQLPYLIVESTLGEIPPAVAVALVETMDVPQLLARLPLLARRGLIDGDVRRALLERLARIDGHCEGLSYQKVESVVRQAGLDRQVAEGLFALVAAPNTNENLTGDTALLVDTSASMSQEIDFLTLAGEIAYRIDKALEPHAQLYAYLFDTDVSQAKVARGSQLQEWRAKLHVPVRRVAGTSVGAAVERVAEQHASVNRLVIVSDGYENRPPRLVAALERYRNLAGRRPSVNFVQPPNSSIQLAVDLRNAQIPFSIFTIDRFGLGLDSLIPSLAAQTGSDRVSEIMAFDLSSI